MSDLKLEINGEEVEASEGQTILEVCDENDIYVPTLCRYVGLSEVGACRMCLVEVDGERLETACTTEVDEGMEIETDTEELWKHRRTILQLIFSEENHYCMYCELEGDCELEEMFRRAGMRSAEFPLSFHKDEVDNSNQFITVDRNRCILCGRCIRACRENVANDTLDFGNRGRETRIIADNDVPLGTSSCISCGACVQACPTGSIYESRSSYRGTAEDCESTKSTCVECSIGCAIDVSSQSGNLVKVNGVEEGDISGGQLCKKGRFEVLDDEREKLLDAQVRKNGEKKIVDLDEALGRVRDVLESSDRINAVMSDRLPTETSELFHGLMKGYGAFFNVIGSEKQKLENEILSELESLGANVDDGILADSVERVLEADNILVYGTNIVETHPVFASYVRRASKDGARLITIDSSEDRLRRHSDISINIGSPESQLTGITLEMLRENVESLSELSDLRLEDININTNDVMQMVSYLRTGEQNVIVAGPGVKDTQSLINIYALAVLTKSKIVSLGPVSNQAVYSLQTDPLDGSADVSYIFAADEEGQKLREMLDIAESSDFVIVQASRRSTLTDMADVVLPSLDWYERSGSFTDVNGDEKSIERILEPSNSIEPDRDVLERLEAGRND